MENIIIAQASKSLDIFLKELLDNSQRSEICIQFQHIRYQSKKYLDLLANHLQNYQHYNYVSINISKNTLIGDEGYQTLAQALKMQVNTQIVKLHLEESCYAESSGIAFLSEALSDLQELNDLTIILDRYNNVQNNGLKYLANIFPKLTNLKKLQIQIAQPNRYDYIGVTAICESIKLIKQLQFLKLDLDIRKVNKQGVQAIASAFEQLNNLENLDVKLSYLEGQIEGIKDLAIAIGKLANLKHFSFTVIQENIIKTEILNELSNSLRNLIQLQSLSLEDLYYFQDEESIIRFADVFNQRHELKKLHLKIESQKFYGQHVALCLFASLKSLVNLTDFKIVIWDNFNLQAEGTSALAEAISHMKNLLNLQICIKSNNKIGHKGAISIGDALGELKQLESLKLFIDYNNLINQEGAQGIAEGIQKLSNLVDLNVQICQNNFLKSNGIHFLGKALSQLNNLNLLKCVIEESITNFGAYGFALGFQNQKKLKQLELSFGDFEVVTKENFKQLFEGFKQLKDLEYLKFSRSGLFNQTNIDLSDLSHSLKYLENLIELELSIIIGQQNDQSYLDFGQAIGSLTKLKKLNLKVSGEQLCSNYFIAVANGIKNLSLVQEMDLNFIGDEIQIDQCQQLTEIFKNSVNLKELKMQLKGDIAQPLGNSFQFLQNLESIHLTLYFNHVSDIVSQDGAISIGSGLAYLKNLQQLDLTLYVSKAQKNLNFIKKGIDQLNNLESLTFYINNDNEQVKDITNSIYQFQNIQNVDLTFTEYFFFKYYNQNIFQDEDQVYSEKKLQEQVILQQELKENYSNLTQISIKFCTTQDQKREDIDEFVKKVINCKKINKICLEFHENLQISSLQSKLITTSLINLHNLNELILAFKCNNGFRAHSAKQLELAFQNLTYLEFLSLEIGDFNQIDEEGANYLAQGIKFLIKLTNLKLLLDKCNIQKQGAISIGNCIQYLNNLRVLSLKISNDKIESEGAISIGRAIKQLTGLFQLSLHIGNQSQINQQGAYGIGQGLENLNNLTSLNLAIEDSNYMQSDGLSNICQAIKNMQDLQFIDLSFGRENLIGSAILQELLSSIQLLKNLEYFQISINLGDISQNFVTEILGFIRLLDQENINFYYTSFSNILTNEITDNINSIFIKCDCNEENKYKEIFSSVQSINQIPQIKSFELQVKDCNNLDLFQLGASLKNLQYLEKINIIVEYSQSGILDLAEGLSKLKNLKYLSLNFPILNDLKGFQLQQIGKSLSQLQNIESIELSFQMLYDYTEKAEERRCFNIMQTDQQNYQNHKENNEDHHLQYIPDSS
ncbi:hypothetical protein ABPG74_018984 [Tetrahymena malaccensis]